LTVIPVTAVSVQITVVLLGETFIVLTGVPCVGFVLKQLEVTDST